MLYTYDAYERTDGGRHSYCWVSSGTVTAKSWRGAITAAKRAVGWRPERHRVTLRTRDMLRIDTICASICMSIDPTTAE